MSAAVLGDVMCLVTKDGGGSTGGLMHTVLTELDGGWSPPAQVGGDITSGSAGITAHNGRFEIFYRERDGGGIFHRSSPDGRQWSNVDFAHHATNDEVCPVSWGDTVLMFFSFVVHESRKRLPGSSRIPRIACYIPSEPWPTASGRSTWPWMRPTTIRIRWTWSFSGPRSRKPTQQTTGGECSAGGQGPRLKERPLGVRCGVQRTAGCSPPNVAWNCDFQRQ